MGPFIRAVTLGVELDIEAPERSVKRAHGFFATLREFLDQYQLAARCLRVTCQPLNAQRTPSFQHAFIVNAEPMALEAEPFAALSDAESFFAPARQYI